MIFLNLNSTADAATGPAKARPASPTSAENKLHSASFVNGEIRSNQHKKLLFPLFVIMLLLSISIPGLPDNIL
jgi:hypothetical protein